MVLALETQGSNDNHHWEKSIVLIWTEFIFKLEIANKTVVQKKVLTTLLILSFNTGKENIKNNTEEAFFSEMENMGFANDGSSDIFRARNQCHQRSHRLQTHICHVNFLKTLTCLSYSNCTFTTKKIIYSTKDIKSCFSRRVGCRRFDHDSTNYF